VPKPYPAEFRRDVVAVARQGLTRTDRGASYFSQSSRHARDHAEYSGVSPQSALHVDRCGAWTAVEMQTTLTDLAAGARTTGAAASDSRSGPARSSRRSSRVSAMSAGRLVNHSSNQSFPRCRRKCGLSRSSTASANRSTTRARPGAPNQPLSYAQKNSITVRRPNSRSWSRYAQPQPMASGAISARSSRGSSSCAGSAGSSTTRQRAPIVTTVSDRCAPPGLPGRVEPLGADSNDRRSARIEASLALVGHETRADSVRPIFRSSGATPGIARSAACLRSLGCT
jgi:hypothetical protein